jgi:hypothetical protein
MSEENGRSAMHLRRSVAITAERDRVRDPVVHRVAVDVMGAADGIRTQRRTSWGPSGAVGSRPRRLLDTGPDRPHAVRSGADTDDGECRAAVSRCSSDGRGSRTKGKEA